MSITILQEPEKCSLALNPTIYKLRTNRVYSSNGRAARASLAVLGLPVAGQDFTLSWGNGAYSITFYFTTLTPTNGKEIQTGTGPVYNYLVDKFVPGLQANYYLDREFSIFIIGTSIFFEAREPGSQFDITFTSTGRWAWDGGFNLHLTGIDRVKNENFRLLTLLYYKYRNENTYHKTTLERIPIDYIGLFDLSTVLGTQNKFILPTIGSNTPLDVSGQIIDYYIRSAESFGATPEVQGLSTSELKYALHGGMNQADSLEFSFNNDILPNFLTSLTQPRVSTAQPFWLTFFNTDAHTAFTMHVSVISNGQEVSGGTLHTFTCARYAQVLLPCSYEFVLAQFPTTDKVDYYRVWVKRTIDQEAFTNIIEPHIMYKPGLDETYLAFRNSFSAYEIYNLLGLKSQNIDFEQKVADVIAEYDKPYTELMPIVFNKSSQVSFQMNTHYLDRDETHKIQDLLHATQVYLIHDGKHIPVVITSQAHDIKSTKSGRANAYTLTLKLIPEKRFSDVGNRI